MCFDMQSPPAVQTQEKKDDDDEGTMPPYDQETQNLIDGKCVWAGLSTFERANFSWKPALWGHFAPSSQFKMAVWGFRLGFRVKYRIEFRFS